MGKPALVDIALMADALRDIGGILGIPSTVDVLLHLPDLVERVRGVAERADTVRVVTADRDALAAEVDARIADAVAADRAAAGDWLRDQGPDAFRLARAIEHGNHIDDDKPPLPSLRMVMLARDELLRQIDEMGESMARLSVKAMQEAEVERDRRIDPVEHARAVMEAYIEGFGDGAEAPKGDARKAWREWSDSRDRLLHRFGGLLAEVER